MKVQSYKYPKSSFLSVEKDLSSIVNQILANDRLTKLLKYTDRDALQKPSLTSEEAFELLGETIRIVPKVYVEQPVRQYLLISFNAFLPNYTNPIYRNHIIQFDIVCHYDQWSLGNFELRPYKIAAELDSMFNGAHLSGIGVTQFQSCTQITINGDEFAGLSLVYEVIHGEEDKIVGPTDNDDLLLVGSQNREINNPISPEEEESIIKNFNQLFNT